MTKRRLKYIIRVLETADAGANNIVVTVNREKDIRMELDEFLRRLKQELAAEDEE